MKNDKIKTSFMVFILIIVEICLYYEAIRDFSVWPKTSSNQANIYFKALYKAYKNDVKLAYQSSFKSYTDLQLLI